MSDGDNMTLKEAAEKLRSFPGKLQVLPDSTGALVEAMGRIADTAEKLAESSERLVKMAEVAAAEFSSASLRPVFVAVPSDARPEVLKRLAEEINAAMNGETGSEVP